MEMIVIKIDNVEIAKEIAEFCRSQIDSGMYGISKFCEYTNILEDLLSDIEAVECGDD